MKNKVLKGLFCFILFLVITGCNKNNLGLKSKYHISNNLVSIEVKENTLTNTKATFIMTNNTSEIYSYGNPYSIEKEIDGIWYELKTINDLFFTMPAFELKINESVEFEIDWEYGYGKLKPGKYRLIKDLDTLNDKNKQIYIASEFTIK